MSDMTSEHALRKIATSTPHQNQLSSRQYPVHGIASPLMLRALQSLGGGASHANTIAQLQRVHGNQQTLQMVREGAARRLTPTRGKLIQLDRLVEIQTGVDKKDFNAVRPQVEKSLGLKSSGKAYNNPGSLAVNDPSETLYLWGHMDGEKIGNSEFTELANSMVELGFRTCREVRLIGCNDQDNPTTAPKVFWHALKNALTKAASTRESEPASSGIDSSSSAITVPTIHATKGPLHSSAETGFDQGWWVATPSEKEEIAKQDQHRVMQYMTNLSYVDPKPSELDNMVSYYAGSTFGGTKLTFRPEPANNTPQNVETLHKFFEKELIDKEKNLKKKGHAYPSLSTGSQVDLETQKTVVAWNPDAWVSYSG